VSNFPEIFSKRGKIFHNPTVKGKKGEKKENENR